MKRATSFVVALALGMPMLLWACSSTQGDRGDTSRGGSGGQLGGGSGAGTLAGYADLSGAGTAESKGGGGATEGGAGGRTSAESGATTTGGSTAGSSPGGSTAGSAAGGSTAGTASAGAGMSAGAGIGGNSAPGIAIPAADRARLDAIRTRAVALQNKIMGFWKQHGPDVQGGFYGELDRQGNTTINTNKFVHTEARHLWTFSTWYRSKEPTAAVKATCDNLFAFVNKFYDSADGRYSYSVARNGGSVTDAKKMLYAQSFVILAFSEYGLAFNNQEAKDKALALFQVIDAGHDASNGGYDQRNDAWSFATPGARKSMNVHMHLMESFTNLYRATGNAVVRERIVELTNLFRNKIVQPQHYYHTEFDVTWKPVVNPPVDEYGHDLQIFWQLINALEPLGLASDTTILNGLASIAEEGAARGLDGQNGYATYGTPGGSRQTGNKVWWVQAEALNGLLRLYLVTGNAVNLDRMEATLGFVERAFLDPVNGELYTETSSTGAPSDTRKGYEWKASYHALRFALLLDLWISDALK